MPEAVARANARMSKVRAGVEHVFAKETPFPDPPRLSAIAGFVTSY